MQSPDSASHRRNCSSPASSACACIAAFLIVAFLATFNCTVYAQLAPAGEAQGAAAIPLTADEREWLARHRDIRLGVDVARPPFEHVDEKGAYTGISAEFIAEAAKRLGITVVPQIGMQWTEAMEKVKVGDIDVIPKVTPSAAREKFLIFTKPYTTYPSVIVTRKDRLAGGLDDLRGLKVGVNKGQIIESNLERDHPELSLVSYPDIEAGLRALATGECDAFIDNLGAVAYAIETVGLANLRIAASTPYTHDLAIGVRKDWPLLASALDKALDSITDQERSEIKNRWLAFKYEAGINWRIVGPIGATLLAIIAFVLMWNRRLGRAIRERERSERKIKAMSQAVDDALVMIDGRGKVLFWNQAAENLFGYTVAEAMGMDFHEMAVPAEARERAQAGMRRFAATGQGLLFGATRETTAINRAGEAFPVEVNLSPFQVDDEWFAVVTVRDITERKKAEDASREYVADLERFNRLVIGREERMIQLKEEINGLTEKLGGEKKYKIV